MADKSRSTLEGGDYECYIHDFRTADPEAWYQHCEDPANQHTEDVQGRCLYCDKKTHAYNLPWKRPDKPKAVICNDCKVSMLGADPVKVQKAEEANAPPKIDFETGEPIPKENTVLEAETGKKKKGDFD